VYDIEDVGFGMACVEYDGHVRLMLKLYDKTIEYKVPIKSDPQKYGGQSIAEMVARCCGIPRMSLTAVLGKMWR
jgi:hypothetical protein